MAQSTVPFLDSVLVEPSPAIPLYGVGLFYKSQAPYGGLVAPKVITSDFAASALRIRGALGVYGL